LFINAVGAQALKDYKYSGTDLSLTYKYILSPLAQYNVDHFTPKSLAPNTITFLGLLFMILSYSTMYLYNPDLTSYPSTLSLPWWIFFLNGSCMLIYQTLDNMDGKQARLTSSSSPLGMLFDHGCDAINSPLGSVNWCVAMGIGSGQTFACFWTLIGSAIPFYFSTWEEYYTGALVLPVINGPSEGLILGAGVSFYTAFAGVEKWHEYGVYDTLFSQTGFAQGIFDDQAAFAANFFESNDEFRGLKNYQLLICLAAFCAIQEAFLKGYSVVRGHGFKTVLNLLPFLALLSCAVVVGVYLPLAVAGNLRSFMCLFGALFVEQVTALMLAHMTKQEMRPFRVVLVPGVAIAGLSYFGVMVDGEESAKVVLMYTIFAFTFVGFKFTVVISEITECLGIYCFDIMTKRGDTVEYVVKKATKASKESSNGGEKKSTRKATRSSSRGRSKKNA